MVSVLIGLVLLLLCGAALAILTDRRIEECVPVVFTGTIVFLYFFYCVNLLAAGRFALYAGITVLIVLGAVRLFRQKSAAAFWRDFFSPGILWFLVLSVLFVIFAAGLLPSVWDELRLWAAMPKALHFAQSLQVGEGSLLYTTMQSYPPGMALLVYFFTSFADAFSYGSIFAVYFIFAAVLVLPAMKDLRWKQWYVFPFVFFLLILMPILLTVSGAQASGDWNFFFTCLYIDPILGCVMGHAFYLAVHRPSKDAFSTLAFTLVLFVLPSLKNIGALYAAIAFVVSVIVALFREKGAASTAAGASEMAAASEMVAAASAKRDAKRGAKVLRIILPVLGVAASYLSWQAIIRVKGTGEFIDMQLSSFTWGKFLNVLKGMTAWGKIPFLYYVLFFIAAGLVVTLVVRDLPKKAAFTGAFGFLAAFLIFFYGYTSHYGWMLSSIHRYTSTFTFAFFIYLLMRLLSAMPQLCDRTGGRLFGEVSFVRHVKKAYLLLLAGLVLMMGGGFLLFQAKHWQLENPAWEDAGRIVAEAETVVREEESAISGDLGSADAEANGSANAGLAAGKASKCYLALGGDIRKQSQRHETYALSAIGTSVNIQNIWCDKLYNEAEYGVVTDPEEMASIWAASLLSGGYEYVIFADPDEEIMDAVHRISPDLGEVTDGMVVKVIPGDGAYGLRLQRVPFPSR